MIGQSSVKNDKIKIKSYLWPVASLTSKVDNNLTKN